MLAKIPLHFGNIGKNFLFVTKFNSTGWYKNSGGSRDEDFFLGSTSTEKGNKIDFNTFSLNDTAHTFTGTRNFADGHARSVISEYRVKTDLKYYLNGADIFEGSNSLFFNFGIHYTYSKYILYDVIQFVDSRPIFFAPIGKGLSYSNSIIELPIGVGYRFTIGDFKFEPNINLLYGFIRARDFHYQRSLNFLAEARGPGFILSLDSYYSISEDLLVKFTFNTHRLFTDAYFKTKGGNNLQDIQSNYLGKYRAYINTKESQLEFSILKKF